MSYTGSVMDQNYDQKCSKPATQAVEQQASYPFTYHILQLEESPCRLDVELLILHILREHVERVEHAGGAHRLLGGVGWGRRRLLQGLGGWGRFLL